MSLAAAILQATEKPSWLLERLPRRTVKNPKPRKTNCLTEGCKNPRIQRSNGQNESWCVECNRKRMREYGRRRK